MKTKLAKFAPNSTKKHKFLSLNNSIKALPNNQSLALFVSTVENAEGKATATYLVFAPVDTQGVPDLDNTVSLELPCPPYCGKGNQVQVITQD